MTDSSLSAVIECPSLEVLVGFDLGELTDVEFETVASHLSRCQKCISILAEWHSRSTDEQFIARLRDCVVDPPATDPVEVETATHIRQIDAQTVSHTEKAGKLAKQPQLLVGRTVGRYLILSQLGSGGMGVVYLAKDPIMGRQVALKMISAESMHKHNRLARFGEEGRVLAAIRHPNVVQIYHFDEYAGLPYFTMEYVEGKTLQDFIPANKSTNKKDSHKPGEQSASVATGVKDRILPIRASVELMKTLALALQAIHEMKIIHRDLKPANILIQTDGTPKIADFGLAKLLDSEGIVNLTQTGHVMGTASYMAPEQATGKVRDIDPQSDVYSLGAVFYELLTGQPPHRGETYMETLNKVSDEEPISPNELRPDVPKLLELICLKALAKNKADRFTDARSLADNLEDWLTGQHPRSIPGAVRRTLQPTRRKAILVGLGTAATAIGAYQYRTNPDVIRRGIEADLRAGKAVTLIGEKGPPKWMKWVAGEAQSVIVPGHEKLFTIQANNDATLVELVENPQTDSYVVELQVRHDSAFNLDMSKVGVYVARQAHGITGGFANFFIQYSYNDILSSIPRIRKEDGQLMPGPEAFYANVLSRFYSDFGYPFNINLNLDGTPSPSIQPAGAAGGTWRTLSIAVSPSGVECTWDGSEPFRLNPATIPSSLQRVKRFLPAESIIHSLQPTYIPQGGIGLYVSKGTASFRSITIHSYLEKDN